jgi:hypothetical protein
LKLFTEKLYRSIRSQFWLSILPAEPVSAIRQRQEWNRFHILVWQHKTSVLKDFDLYRKVGLHGFHIDRGAAAIKKVQYSLKEKIPYYVDHAADKGFLYLKGNNVAAVTGKRELVIRPNSLADPETILKIKKHLNRNISQTKKGLVLAYAYDDEISLGSFVIPCDVDKHPLSIAWFREWLRYEYGTIKQLNNQWDSSFKSFDDVMPKGFEQIRKEMRNPSISHWNLSPWMDFRHFMDFQFAAVLAELARYANSIDPHIPAGFVGGQGPGPWGGYDYALLSRAVQWMEAYDVHGTNEILRSFWNKDRRPRMQTFFSTKNFKLDSWFIWYYMLHGNQAVIAWPEGWFHADGKEIASHIVALKETFKEVQGKISEPLVSSKTTFDPDPIGIYYSHPSIQLGWAMDAIAHDRTWIKRKGSIDNENQTMGVLRKVWCKTLEDLGFQYDFVSYLDVQEGKVDLNKKFKVIILPKTVCLSDVEAKVLKKFVTNGGILIADYLFGLMDEHGKARSKGALDDLFGLIRNESKGYMNGEGLIEIDGEKYKEPYLLRFANYDGAYRYNDIVVFERGTKHREDANGNKIRDFLSLFHRASVIIAKDTGRGRTFYLNLSPLEYWSPEKRFGEYGHEWRKIVSQIMQSAGLTPRVVIYEKGNSVNMIEPLYWKNGERTYLGLIKNPTEPKKLARLGTTFPIEGITGQEVNIEMAFDAAVNLINLRTGEHLGMGQVIRDRFKPWEGNLYEVKY